MPEILLVSTSIDVPTYGPVAERLHEKGHDAIIYLADRVANGTDQLSVSIGENSDTHITYNGNSLPLATMQSAWYRHPNLFGFDLDDKAKQMCLEQEISDLQDSLWLIVPDEAWLNDPNQMRRAQSKIAQLILAQELGFTVPKTAVGNNWQDIDASLGSDYIIAKMSRGVLYDGDETKAVYTTKLDQERRDALRRLSPFPAIYQEYVTKHREWRVTVVGDRVFPAAIYTDTEAKVDWRVHQLTGKVKFVDEPIRDDIPEICFNYLGHFGLAYGAFDFIEDEDGKITFLECNTNGQYRWLEDSLGLPISEAIVDNLVSKLGN